MRGRLTILPVLVLVTPLAAQAPKKFPPDSLVNVQVVPKTTPVIQLIGTMRNFTSYLGVRCPFCHVGIEGQDLSLFDFASDSLRTKRVARQMMRMVAEINQRLDTIPELARGGIAVTCGTCHHGVNRPMPLSALIGGVAETSGADSAVRAYRTLRERYYGSDAYNFGENSLNTAAFRLGRAKKFTEAFALLDLNEGLYPNSSGMSVFRGNIALMQGDTTAAAKAYREAIRRDPGNDEAKGRLQNIGQKP